MLSRAKYRSSTAKAADGGRTRDLKLGKLALYQLSYRRTATHLTRRRLQCPCSGD